MIQTLAILLDAYRELNSKKLFWITLILSGLVVAVFASFGINEKGYTFLHFVFDHKVINSKLVPPEKFYKFAFAVFAVPVWLTWAASILALISTASIFPDFLAGGAIELSLSKPIGRLRLFLTKYTTGLLFATVQVLVFTVACILVIGIRGKSWEFSLLLAVPVVVVFFSYLFSVCTLFGMLTRSTIASLLLTLLVWLACWGVNTADGLFTIQKQTTSVNAERADRKVTRLEDAARKTLQDRRDRGEPTPAEKGPLDSKFADELEAVNVMLKPARVDAKSAHESAANWQKYCRIVMGVQSVLPKTAQTIGLLNRWLLTTDDENLFSGPQQSQDEESEEQVRFGERDADVINKVEDDLRGRSVLWVVGTSLIFEAVMLSIAGWIFCRRDF